MNYITQSELIDNAKKGWSDYADGLGVVIGEVIAKRLSPAWNYIVHNTDTPNGTRAQLESAWVYFDETAHDATNSFDTRQNTTVNGTYYCKSSKNNFGGFRMDTSIDGAQRSWRNLSIIQASEGTDEQYNFYPPTKINFPVFTNYNDGVGFSTAMYNYLENPTDENYVLAVNALAKSINPKKDKNPYFGEFSEPAGGYNPDGTHGTFDDSSDIVPVPHLPTKGVTSAGFINVYVIQNNELQRLGEKLFPHFLPAELLADPSQLTTPEMLAIILKSFFGTLLSPAGTSVEIADNLGIIDILMNGKLIDYVLDCHIIPTAISGATVEGLKVGYRQFNDLQLAKATTDYVEIDCGSLSIGEYWANFLDYSCTVKLFLPFVGFVPIENEYWNGGTIKVIYHFNIIDGSFQAYVVATSSKSELTETVIGQYGGVCCVHMPITGLQYSNVVAGLVNGTAGAVASGYGGDVAGAVTNALNMAMLRPDAPSSNGYNASSGFLSERYPYLVIERPASQFSEMYNKEMGLPLNVMEKLSNVHGFTVIDNPVLHISCSDAEYKELVSLLKNGVILP